MPFNASGPKTTTGGYAEILAYPTGDQAMASIVLDASTVSADASGVRKILGGTLLSKNANGQYERYVAGPSQAIKGVLAYDVEFYDATPNDDTPAAMFFHDAVFRADRIVDYNLYGSAAATALKTCLFR